MRILTPAELRQLETIRGKTISGIITGIDLYGESDNLIDTLDKELWLNILDIVLQANESMKLAWRNSPGSNMTSEVLDKLRPNG